MLDFRNMACPQPVLMTKQEIEKNSPDLMEILLDNQAAVTNVGRFLNGQGYEYQVAEKAGDFLISAKAGPQGLSVKAPEPSDLTCEVSRNSEPQRQLVFIRSERIGHGDDELGAGLMKNYLLTLNEMGDGLWRIIFLNGGVKLCVEGSKSIDALKKLEERGISILVCGTCLSFFGLLDKKQVGETTNMLDVVTSLEEADKVITV